MELKKTTINTKCREYSLPHKCIVLLVIPRYTKEIVEMLKHSMLFNDSYRVEKYHGIRNLTAIPIEKDSVHIVKEFIRNNPSIYIDLVEVICKPRKIHGMTFKDLLKDILPEDILARIPSSFYIVGDIALISIDDDIADRYGELIAKAIMCLHPSIRAVYAKHQTVGIERTRLVKFLGGDRKTTTLYKEHGLKMLVDIEKVYINPALSTEHKLVSDYIERNQLILDLFTGIGPFVLHAARKDYVYAIACDINLEALKLLIKNISLNKIKGLIDVIATDSFRMVDGLRRDCFDHIIANLPHRALELLCKMIEMVVSGGYIHIYSIAKSEQEVLDNIHRKTLTCRDKYRDLQVVEVRKVLDYAPRKYVYRATLRIFK